MTEEIADLVDERDEVVGAAPRSEVRRLKLLHRGVCILVRDPARRVYVHRRTDDKDVFPGMYSQFVGGMVASGEGYEETARRELAEELGIVATDLVAVARLRMTGDNPHWAQVYETLWRGEVVPDPGEIAWGAFLSEAELARALEEWPFSPDAREVWRRCFAPPRPDGRRFSRP